MKKAAVIGYGKSGAAAARILKLQGFEQIDFYDDKKDGCKALDSFTDIYDMTVISPGVPLRALKMMPSAYTSEVELAYSELPQDSIVLGITGTNGKSTVTHLTAQILNNAGIKAVACGNIGYTFADAVLDNPADVYVLELSSFQIELIHDLELHSAVLTNLTPDHLDRYESYAEYIHSKLMITRYIDIEGTLIADPAPEVVNSLLRVPYKVRYVDKDLKAWPKLDGQNLNFGEYHVDLNAFSLFGRHNIVNLAFALSLAATVVEFEGDVTQLIEGISGMPHRTELILEQDGVKWINDSKATNVDSVLIALKSCNYPSILLLGGKDKKGDFRALINEINRACALVITFGGAAELIYKQLESKIDVPLMQSGNLREATELAYNRSRSDGYTVILSPGCASFDEFSSFEERGTEFARYVRELNKCLI